MFGRSCMRISSRFKKALLAVLFVVGIYALMVVTLKAIGLENVHRSIQQMGMWSPIVFLLICTASMVIAPLSAGSIFVTGGLLFGKPIGFLLSLLGSVLGCTINFWISRLWGRKVVARLVGKSSLEDLDNFTHRLNNRHSILFMTLVMPIAQDMLSYAIGLTQVKFWHFFISMLIGGIAVVAVYIYFGSSLLEALI